MAKVVTVIRRNDDYFAVVDGVLSREQKSKWCEAYDCSYVKAKGVKKEDLMSFQEVTLLENDTNPDVSDDLVEVDVSTFPLVIALPNVPLTVN